MPFGLKNEVLVLRVKRVDELFEHFGAGIEQFSEAGIASDFARRGRLDRRDTPHQYH